MIYDITSQWDVPLMVTRGYPSLSYLLEAAEAIKAKDKPTHIYYPGDFDPSGVDIPRKVEADLRRMAPESEIHFTRLAVTEDQIDTWHLPTRPTKTSDSRAKAFGSRSVEVDAIPSRVLRGFVELHVKMHTDNAQLEVLETAERSERQRLNEITQQWGQQ